MTDREMLRVDVRRAVAEARAGAFVSGHDLLTTQAKRWQRLAELGDAGALMEAARYRQALKDYCDTFGVRLPQAR